VAKNLLRELSRQIPSPPEIKKIINDLLNRDDLNIAITAVSIVEAHLEKLLVSRLHRSDKDFTNRLFENRGPLSDFNSRILIAEAFGLLTRPLADELHLLRAIRNAFAHAKMTLTFDMEPVESEVRKLKLLTTIGGGKIPGPIKHSIAAQLSSFYISLPALVCACLVSRAHVRANIYGSRISEGVEGRGVSAKRSVGNSISSRKD
jgi:DNA-binding MltR family transcriptional regulator